MKKVGAFIERRPLLSYFVLTFALSWGGFVLVVGPGGFGSTNWQAESLFLCGSIEIPRKPAKIDSNASGGHTWLERINGFDFPVFA